MAPRRESKGGRKPVEKGGRTFGQIRRLPSKRWQASYPDPEGRTYISGEGETARVKQVRYTAPQTYDTRQDAEAWLIDERRLISAGLWSPPAERLAAKLAKPLTMGEYAEAWLTGRKVKGRPLADRTRDGYRDLLDRFILPNFQDVPLTHITPDMVDHWYEITAVDRPSYRAQAYSLLRTILGTAVDRGLIKTANPAKVRGAGSAARRHKVKPATLAELAQITAAMPERRRLMIQLAAWCGLRFGELAELRRKDIDVKAKVIKIRRGVVRTKQSGDDGTAQVVRRIKTPKTEAGVRDVPIPPHLLADVRAHLLEHCAPGRDGLLFPGADEDTHMSTSAFYGRVSEFHKDGRTKRKGYGFHEARRVAGREDLHFHDLRHTGLTNAAVAGATLAELMALAGHSTPSAAMRYQHAAQDRMQDLAAKLSLMAEAE